VFTGNTSALRALLNQLAGFELPVIVRAVEVEPAGARGLFGCRRGKSDPAAAPIAPAGLDRAQCSCGANLRPNPLAVIAPIVARSVSKFTVTLEFVALVPPPAAAAASAP